MKANFKLVSTLAGSTLVALAPVSNAVAKYWDSISPTTSGADGGSGTWNTTTNNWRTASTGGSQTTYGTGGQQAAFNNTASGDYTVTVSGTVQISGTGTGAGTAGIWSAADPAHPYTFSGTGTIQLTAASFIAANSGTIFGSGLTIDNNGQALTFSNGSVVDALITGSGSLTKGGGGILRLNNTSNSFSGAVTFTQGTIEVKTLKNSGSTSSLGTGSTITIGTANAGDTQTLRYTGTGGADGTTNRAISLSPTTGTNAFTFSLDQSGTGLVTFSGGISSATNSAKTLNLTGSTSGTGEISGAITNGSSGSVAITKSGSGTWTLSSGSNTFTGGTSINAGTLQIDHANALGTSGTIAFGGGTLMYGTGITTDLSSRFSTAASQAYKIDTNGNNVTLNTALTSSGGSLTKSGAGTLTITSPTYTGATTVNGGKLVINGATASTSLVVNGSLGGSGTMANATLSGSGSIDPGNSPGILTALDTDPSGGLDYNFEFTAVNTMPTWSNASASGNDVLRLTDGASPFNSALGAPNTISIYLNAGALALGQVFSGGFYTDRNSNFLSSINSATFRYLVATGGAGTETYNGTNYDLYTGPLTFNVNTVQVASADFAGGTVNGGYVSQFTVVPEPGAALVGGLGLLALLRRRRQ